MAAAVGEARRLRGAPAIGSLGRSVVPYLAPGLLAGVLSLLLFLVGPPGVDRAAHVYHTEQFATQGFALWNNYWYAGRYELVNYSILYYPLALVLGHMAVVTASVAAASSAIAALCERLAGRRGRAAAYAFALALPWVVAAGQYPFALGAAAASLALLAFAARRRSFGVLAALLALLSSPLSFLLATIVLAGAVVVGGRRRDLVGYRPAAIAVAAMALFEVVLLRAFPSGGQYPYPLDDAIGVSVLCAGGLAIARRDRLLRGVFAVYGLVAWAAFAYPSGVGGNATRLMHYAGVSLLMLALARRERPFDRRVAVLLLLAVGAWQVVPIVRDVRGGLRQRADAAAFWTPTIAFLSANRNPDYRVEVVGTWGHWESHYLPQAGIALTRGWFRQDDFPVNLPLYDGNLDGARYRDWLRSLGVRYVVLPNEELDYSARLEARILEQPDHGGLKLVAANPYARIFELPDTTPILTRHVVAASRADEEPHILHADATRLSLWLPTAGSYDLRVRYTPYWRAGEPASVCIERGTNDLTRLHVDHGGPVALSFDASLARSTSAALGTAGSSCPAAASAIP